MDQKKDRRVFANGPSLREETPKKGRGKTNAAPHKLMCAAQKIKRLLARNDNLSRNCANFLGNGNVVDQAKVLRTAGNSLTPLTYDLTYEVICNIHC